MAITRTLYGPDGRSLSLDAAKYNVTRSALEGHPPVRHIERAIPLGDGAVMEDLFADPVTITITAKLLASTRDGLTARHAAINSLLRLNRRRARAEYWRYVETSYSGNAAELRCYPAGKLSQPREGFNQEIGLQLRATDPFWYAQSEEEIDIAFTQTLTTRHIVGKVDGEWTELGPPAAGVTASGGGSVVEDLFYDAATNRLYVVGDFTNWDGTAANDYFVYYDFDTEAWATLGTPSVGSIYPVTVYVSPDGEIHVGGSFTNFAGVAAADNYAYWDGSAWAARGTGPGGTVQAIAMEPDSGTIYVGGSFSGTGCKYWSGSAWTNAGSSGMTIRAMAFAPDGTLYAVGTSSSYAVLKSYDGSTWTTLATADTLSSFAFDMVLLDDGRIIVVGSNLDPVDGENLYPTGDGVFLWNGYAAYGLDTGLIYGPGNGQAEQVARDDDGTVYVVGYFDEAGGLDTIGGYARWNGFTWAHVPIGLPAALASGLVSAVEANNGNVYFGLNTAGDLTAAAATTVSNRGSADVSPVFVIEGPATLQSIANATSGQEMLFNLYVNEGETVTIDTRPGRRSVVSDWRGRLEALPGGDDDGFVLRPGDNLITAYAEDTTSDTAITCKFTPRWYSWTEAVRNLVHEVADDDLAAVFGPVWDIFSRGGTYYARSRISPNDREATVAGGWREEDDAAGLTLIRAATNLVTNPNFETDTTGWGTAGSNTIERTAARSLYGSYALKCTYADVNTLVFYTATLTVADYVFSAWVWVPNTWDGGNIYISAGGLSGSTDVVLAQWSTGDPTGAWTYVATRITPDAGDLTGGIWIRFSSAPTAGRHIYVDGALLINAAYPIPSFDGDTPGATWSGTAHNSTSSIATGGSCSLTNPLSVSAGAVGIWYTPAADQDGPTRYLFSEGSIEAYFNAADNKFYLTDGTNTISTAAQTFSADEEIFLAFVWASSRLEIYVDGASAASGTSFTAPTIGATLYIGTDSLSANQCDGALRQWFATTRALSDDEVAAIYAEDVVP
jgi:hypothetical protein